MSRITLVAALAVLGAAGNAPAQITGFGGTAMTGWTPNANAAAVTAGVPNVTGTGTVSDVLTLTTAAGGQATSYWFNTPQNITNFTQSFTYRDVTTNGADGITAAWQNAGVTALGDGGGARGFAGATGISSAAALAMNIFNNSSSHYVTSTTAGGLPNSLTPGTPASVNIRSGNPINVTLSYRQTDGALTETMTDTVTNNTFTRVWRGVDIQAAVGGPTAIVGFTGGTGGVTANQTITNFQFTPGNAPPTPVATITPIAATGYNQNMILSATSGAANVTATMDGGTALTGDTFYERGTNTAAPLTGVPTAGTPIGSASDANHVFVLQPNGAGQNNAVMLDATSTTGSLTLTTPTPYTALSFLVSNGGGATTIGVTVNYAGGGTQTATINSPDWFNTVNGAMAVFANGRGNTTGGFNNVNNAQPRMFQQDLLLTDLSSNVVSVDFTYGGAGRTAIFGISGTPVPEPSTMALVTVGAVGFLARRFRRAK